MVEKGKRKTKTGVVVVGIVVILVILAAVFVRGRAPDVPVVRVTREDLTADITSNGKIEPISPTVAHAEFPTFVTKVMATEGQAVHRGQLILTLDSADMRAQLAQARADLITAQNELQNARSGGPPDQVAQLKGDLQAARIEVNNEEKTLKELESLVPKHAATEGEVAQSREQLAKARANLQTLEAKKQSMDKRAADTEQAASLRVNQAQNVEQSLEEKVRSARVVAPQDGTLYSLPVKQGDYVKVGDTLAEMADLRKVRVRAFVDEPDLGALAQGQEVEITWDAKPGQTWKGQTEEIPKQVVTRGMRSVGEVLCSVDNDRLELLPNVNVQVRILVQQRRGVLVVPRAAVSEAETQHYVFLVGADNKVHRRDISVGVASASKYEVVSGLGLDDRVAEPVDRQLRNGMQIQPSEAP